MLSGLVDAKAEQWKGFLKWHADARDLVKSRTEDDASQLLAA